MHIYSIFFNFFIVLIHIMERIDYYSFIATLIIIIMLGCIIYQLRNDKIYKEYYTNTTNNTNTDTGFIDSISNAITDISTLNINNIAKTNKNENQACKYYRPPTVSIDYTNTTDDNLPWDSLVGEGTYESNIEYDKYYISSPDNDINELYF